MANLLIDGYKWLFTELADPWVNDWAFMGSPVPVLFCVVLYLYMIKVRLPEFMRDRPPYDLKNVINAYNVAQVVVNAILFWGLLNSGWRTTLHLGCQMPDRSDPLALDMAKWMWWVLVVRVFDLVETSFFVLRKKDAQASFLHIYHHVATLSVLWCAVKYLPGAMASLTPLINTLVHTIMYSYYLVSSNAGPELRRKLNKWKMWITVVQMTQFTILAVHSLQALKPSCKAPMALFWVYFPNLVVVYYLFWDFFRKTYLSRRKTDVEKRQQKGAAAGKQQNRQFNDSIKTATKKVA